MEKYLEELLKLSKKAYQKSEIPVGCIIVHKNIIVARAYNLRETKKDVLGHAEIIAIKQANIKMNNWRLTDCDMYVTLAPCKMCQAVIEEARLKKVYYLLENQNVGLQNKNHKYQKINNCEYEENYIKTFKKMFQKLR